MNFVSSNLAETIMAIQMKQQNKLFSLYIILFVLNTLTAIVYNLFNETLTLIPMRVGVALINGAGFTLITTFIIHLIQKYTRIYLGIPLLMLTAFVFLIESFLLLNFYSLVTPSIILVMLETNPDETSEFFHTYFNRPTWILLGCIAIAIGLCVRYRKQIVGIHLPGFLTSKNRLHILCFTILAVYVGLVYYVTQVRHMTSYQMLTGVERIWHSTRNTLKDRAEQLKYMELIKKEPPHVSAQSDTTRTIPYVVIILNESISKWHMNAYGYPRLTTPLLNERIKNGETTLFQQVQTPRAITAEAIRQIRTFHDESDAKEWYQCYTLPAIMKAAGYYTSWISNQDSFTRGGENSTHSIATTSDTVLFTHQRHASEERFGYFDEDLLPLLDRQLERSKQANFICLHLMGAHQRYTNRYPSAFSQFGIDEGRTDLTYAQKMTVAEYDNCILYSDYVCNEVVRRFEEKEAIVVCFPDHGEEVYDTRHMSGHNAYNPSDPMKKIPFWIWTSRLFQAKRGDMATRIRQSDRNSFNTSHLIHTIMDLCGLQSPEYEEKKSLFYASSDPTTVH